jgi:hypothetical protein
VPYLIKTTRHGGWDPEANATATFQSVAVATLDERYLFDGNEWRRAGFDQPDGNYQFWHPALILERTKSRDGENTATVLFLHDGRISHGHFITDLEGVPGGRTSARDELVEAGHWPRNWPDPIFPEADGTIDLPDGTRITVEHIDWPVLAERAYANGGWSMKPGEILNAYNQKNNTPA